VPMIRTGHLDAAFVLWPADEPPPRGVDGLPMADERLIAIGARRRPRPASLHALDGADWILNPQGCAARATLLETLRKAQLASRIVVETYTYETQLALVGRGRGFGLVPERQLQASHHRAEVRPLGLPELEFPLRIWALHRALPAELAAPFATVCDELSRVLRRGRRR